MADRNAEALDNRWKGQHQRGIVNASGGHFFTRTKEIGYRWYGRNAETSRTGAEGHRTLYPKGERGGRSCPAHIATQNPAAEPERLRGPTACTLEEGPERLCTGACLNPKAMGQRGVGAYPRGRDDRCPKAAKRRSQRRHPARQARCPKTPDTAAYAPRDPRPPHRRCRTVGRRTEGPGGEKRSAGV